MRNGNYPIGQKYNLKKYLHQLQPDPLVAKPGFEFKFVHIQNVFTPKMTGKEMHENRTR